MKATAPKTSRIDTRVGDLAGLDGFEHEALGLFVPSDVRPLRGVAGFVDWRCDGALSRTLLSKTFVGREKEVLLAPTRGRLGPRRFFLFGIGPAKSCNVERLRAACLNALFVLQNAGVAPVVLAAPSGPDGDNLEERFIGVTSSLGRDKIELVLVPPAPSAPLHP